MLLTTCDSKAVIKVSVRSSWPVVENDSPEEADRVGDSVKDMVDPDAEMCGSAIDDSVEDTMKEDALVAIVSEGSNDVTSLAIVVLERIPVADEADNDLVVSLKPEGATPEIGDPDEPGWTTVVDDGTAEVGREGGMDTVDVASTKEVTGGPTSLGD